MTNIEYIVSMSEDWIYMNHGLCPVWCLSIFNVFSAVVRHTCDKRIRHTMPNCTWPPCTIKTSIEVLPRNLFPSPSLCNINIFSLNNKIINILIFLILFLVPSPVTGIEILWVKETSNNIYYCEIHHSYFYLKINYVNHTD